MSHHIIHIVVRSWTQILVVGYNMVECRTHYESPRSQYLASRFLSLMSLSASLCSFFSPCWFKLELYSICLVSFSLLLSLIISILYNRTLYPHALYIYTIVLEHFTLPYLPARMFRTCFDKMPRTFQLSFKPIYIWYHYARCVILHLINLQYNVNCFFSYCLGKHSLSTLYSHFHHIMIGMTTWRCELFISILSPCVLYVVCLAKE